MVLTVLLLLAAADFFSSLALATTVSAWVVLKAFPALAAGVFLAMSAQSFFFTDFLAAGVLRTDLGVFTLMETLFEGVGLGVAPTALFFRADFGATIGVFLADFGVFFADLGVLLTGLGEAFLAGVWKRVFIGVGSGLLA